MVIYESPKNQYIFRQKDPGTLFFIIKSGKV
jgi:CRP-like cAMP-binding protein